jgi:peptide/nickel transport system substrate-binding protein
MFRSRTISVCLIAMMLAACKPAALTPGALTPNAVPSQINTPAAHVSPQASSALPAGTETLLPGTIASSTATLAPMPSPTLPASLTPLPASSQLVSSQPVSVTIGWIGKFDILNPYYSDSEFTRFVQQLWLPSPWVFDDHGSPQPTLVEQLPSLANGSVSADGKTITLRLRKNLTWSDGEPLTSADFAFTDQMANNSENINFIPDAFSLITGVDTPDPYTVVTHLSEADAQWLLDLWPAVLPKHILEPVFQQNGTIDDADWNSAPTTGAGPYVFAGVAKGSQVRFLANTNYWGEHPHINEIDLQLFSNASSLQAALADGSIEAGLPLSAAQALSAQASGYQALPAYNGYNEGWYFYLDAQKGQPALQDAAVRRALALAFNRQKLVQDLFQGLSQPAATFWDGSPYADPSLKAYPYDPQQAKNLLDQAGWFDTNGDGVRDKDGVPLALKYGTTTDPLRKAAQTQAQSDFQAIGVKLQLLSYAPGTLFASFAQGGPAASGKLDIMEWADKPDYPDPATSYWLCSEIPSAANPDGNNWQALCDSGLDGLFQKAGQQADPSQRQGTFREISQTIYDQVYWLGLWQDPDYWAISPRLQNVHPSAASPFFDVVEWQVKH